MLAKNGATLSPLKPGPHQIFNKMTSGPHQKMTSVLGLINEWLPLIENTVHRLVKSLNVYMSY